MNWNEIIELYYDPIYGFCRQFLGGAAEAEDATQEVFFKAFKKQADLRDTKAAKAWLYSIARCECLDRTRWWRRLAVWRAAQPTAEPRTEGLGELGRAVLEELANLPTRQREVFILRHWHGFSTKETAELLGISDGTVKSQLKRAVDTVKAALCVEAALVTTEKALETSMS